MLLEKKWILKFCFRLCKIQTAELVRLHAKNAWRKATSKKFGMESTWKKKKIKISKFADAGSINGNEREGFNNMDGSTEKNGEEKLN